jgi:hypothetical protein
MHIHVAPLVTGKPNILKDAKGAQIETDQTKEPTVLTQTGSRVVAAYFIADTATPPAVVSSIKTI